MGIFRSAAESFLTKAEGKRIVQAIQSAEQQTSGEIRVHLEPHTTKEPLERAGEVFGELEMHETDQRNGVLIYLATEDHRFAIFADEGINQVVPAGFWDDIATQMAQQFKQKAFVVGLMEGIAKIGEQLTVFFPYESDDKNELPDDISYG